MVIRGLIPEGWKITLEDLAVLAVSDAGIQCFGVYATEEIPLTREPFDAHLSRVRPGRIGGRAAT